MKRSTLLFFLCMLSISVTSVSAQSVGINNTGAQPHASAMLDVNSTAKGMLIPRMTSVQRAAIPSPGVGLMVFDTDTKTFWYHNGVTWVNQASGGGGFTLPFAATENQANEVFKIINNGMGASLSGITNHEFGRGLVGVATGAFGQAIYGSAALPDAIAVFGEGTGATGVRGYSATGFGMEARSTSNSAIRASIIQGANSNPTILATHAGSGAAIRGTSQTGHAIIGTTFTTSPNAAAIFGENQGTQGSGIYGVANAVGAFGVQGLANQGTGVSGTTSSGKGVSGTSLNGTALYGSSASGYGLEVEGKVRISGGNTNPSSGAVLTSDAFGNAVWKNNNFAFSVHKINPNAYTVPKETNYTVHLFEEEFDRGGRYAEYSGSSPAFGNSVFNPTVSGIYHFSAGLILDGKIGNNDIGLSLPTLSLIAIRNGQRIKLVSVKFCPTFRNAAFLVTEGQASFSKDVRLLSGDIVFLEIYHTSTASLQIYGYEAPPYFSGHLVMAD